MIRCLNEWHFDEILGFCVSIFLDWGTCKVPCLNALTASEHSSFATGIIIRAESRNFSRGISVQPQLPYGLSEERLSWKYCIRWPFKDDLYRGIQEASIGRRVEIIASPLSLTQKKLSFALLGCAEIDFECRVTGFLYEPNIPLEALCRIRKMRRNEQIESSSTPPAQCAVKGLNFLETTLLSV